MSNLYFLGGAPRTGKSTIVADMSKRHPLTVIATDAIAEAVRNMLTDDPFRILREIKIEGYVKYKDPETDKIHTKNLDEYPQHGYPQHANHLVLRGILGMLDHYKAGKGDVLVEGCIFEPDWISRHPFEGFKVRAAFVGFSDEAQIDEIIQYAKSNESDWINDLLRRYDDKDAPVKERLNKYIESSLLTEKAAQARGYGYFDKSTMPFEEYRKSVVDYLLSDK